jgi:hypothetical protein
MSAIWESANWTRQFGIRQTGNRQFGMLPFFHWDANYCTYHTFFSHVKARIDVDIKTFDIRFGSDDDEGGLTKALDSVFPNSSRLLCTKHM